MTDLCAYAHWPTDHCCCRFEYGNMPASKGKSHMWLGKCLLKLVDSENEQASLYSAVTKLRHLNRDLLPLAKQSRFVYCCKICLKLRTDQWETPLSHAAYSNKHGLADGITHDRHTPDYAQQRAGTTCHQTEQLSAVISSLPATDLQVQQFLCICYAPKLPRLSPHTGCTQLPE